MPSILLKTRPNWLRFWANMSRIISLKLTCHFPFSTPRFREFHRFSISRRNGGFNLHVRTALDAGNYVPDESQLFWLWKKPQRPLNLTYRDKNGAVLGFTLWSKLKCLRTANWLVLKKRYCIIFPQPITFNVRIMN